MKYRILNREELSHLDEQLKQFLIVNGIDGDEWKRINEEEADKAIDLVEIFSDRVLQLVYEKIFYVEKRTEDAFFIFHCKHALIDLIAIEKKDKSDKIINFSTAEGIQAALSKYAKKLNFYESQKKYDNEREVEIHRLFTEGCIISSKDLWDELKKVIEK